MNNTNLNCFITGVGGQGTVLASKLLAEAAIQKGYEVRTTETIGMAQRGGSVVSHVRMGKEIFSPLIARGQADMIIGFEPAEVVRLLPYLKPEGKVVVSINAIKPIVNPEYYKVEEILDFLKRQVSELILIDGEKICEVANNPRGLNIALLGAALSTHLFPITQEEMEDVIRTKVKAQFVASNLCVFKMGYEEGTK